MNNPNTANIFGELPPVLPAELFETLASADGVCIERIISLGHCTAEGEWLDQDRDEWVLIVSGNAALLLEGEPAPRSLSTGDYLFIPAHRRHRVTWTDPCKHTIWLAVHFGRKPAA